MKRFLPLALTAGLISPIATEAFWKYGSFYEAKKACEKWLLAGPQYSYEKIINQDDPNYDPNFKYDPNLLPIQVNIRGNYLRKCTVEKETNQVLGFLNTDIEKGKFYRLRNGWKNVVPEKKNFELIKRFKY